MLQHQFLQSANLTWNNTSNTISTSNFVGSGSAKTNLNASNVSLGTLSISRGGIGANIICVYIYICFKFVPIKLIIISCAHCASASHSVELIKCLGTVK
jgi:hypothetical protein